MRIISLLLVLTFTLFASTQAAQELGYHTDYQQALAVAKKEQKPVMLVVVTTYCPWCRKFERKTLASKKIAPIVMSMYIPVIVDRNNDAEHFPKAFQTPRVPTVFFIDPKDENGYWESIGYRTISEFADTLKEADALFKERQK